MALVTPRRRPRTVPRSDIRQLLSALRALCDENRLTILSLLTGGELCVCEILDALRLPQNLVSHHLAILRQEGLVRDRRDAGDARRVYYSIVPQAVAELQAELARLFDLSYMDTTPADCREINNPMQI